MNLKFVEDQKFMQGSDQELAEKADEQLDLRGLNCPMPLLKTKQRLNRLEKDQLLFVTTTDQGSVRDFNAFINLSAHELITQTENLSAGEYYFLIRCG